MKVDIPKKCDVVVIGGGPAGSMASTFLSQKGYDVVLLEKQKHPRPHIGENLLPHFWKYADIAQVSDKIIAEEFVKKTGSTVIWDGIIRQIAFKDFGYSRNSFHVERDRFDQILLENSQEQGTHVFEEVAVLEVDLHNSGEQQKVKYRLVDDKTLGEITCRFIVDASGQNAVVARQLGLRVIDEGFRFMSMWGYFENSQYIGGDGQIHPFNQLKTILPTTFISSLKETGDWGWSWHIPLKEKTSVGLVLPQDFLKIAKTAGESWESYFLRKCREIPVLSNLLANAQFCSGSFAKIPDYSYRSNQLAGPGFFLIGDASGFIDPIFSAGIILGMYSAYLASWAIDRSFKKPGLEVQSQALFTSQLQGRLEMNRSLALPNYQSGEQASELAKRSMQLDSTNRQELMNVASILTTRSDNFQDIVADSETKEPTSQKFKVLEELASK